MIKRILGLALIQCCFVLPVCFSADVPAQASEASVKQLLEVSQVHKILDTTMAQMDGFMKQAMQQAAAGQSLTPRVQKDVERRQTEMMAVFKEMLDWNKLEPMYIRIYQKSFTQPEIDSLIAMYKSPGGQMLLSKMPIVMQNTMGEMQQMIQPMIQKIQRMQQEVVAEIQAEKGKSG